MDTQGSLGDILNSLMQNPEIMKTVQSFAKGEGSDSQKEEVPSVSEVNAPGADFQIPPEILSKLPAMMSALSGMGMGGIPKIDSKDGPKADRKELLRALRPFLSEKRCSVIDSLLQFEGLYGVLDSLKGK